MIMTERVVATIRETTMDPQLIEVPRNNNGMPYFTCAVQVIESRPIPRSRKQRNSGESERSVQISPSGYDSLFLLSIRTLASEFCV